METSTLKRVKFDKTKVTDEELNAMVERAVTAALKVGEGGAPAGLR